MVVEVRSKTKIVDADGHYLEPPFALPEYIEAQYKDIAPRIVTKDDGTEWWEGKLWRDFNPHLAASNSHRATAVPGLAGVERWNQGVSLSDVKGLNYTQMNPASIDPGARLQVMDNECIDKAVLYPTMNLMWMEDAEYHLAINRALNDWLADFVKQGQGRLYGAVNIVTLHDVEVACAEVRRCVKEYGFKAVFLRPTLPNADVRWWHSIYDPFWSTCQELDVAVALHDFPGDRMFGSARAFDLIGPSPEQHFLRTAVNPVVDMMVCYSGMMAGGIFERFPRLRLAILEASGGWLVTFLERLDHRFEHLGHTVPAIKLPPSEYFKRQCWISFDPEEAALPMTAEWLGADRIIWGSDFPHPDAFYPNFVAMLNRKIGSLSTTDQDKIRGLNALDFYKL